MKNLVSSLVGLVALSVVPVVCFGQDGSDINQAIPIYFGQTVNDIGDFKTFPIRVYSVTLAKGQQFTAVFTIPNGQPAATVQIALLPPDRKTTGGCGYSCNKEVLINNYSGGTHSLTFTYQVASAGTYFLQTDFASAGVSYSLQITAIGTPIAIPLPQIAGCLAGQVDYITYSLQLIAASLPDEASIGGTKLCLTCTVKPPAYQQLVSKMETAMGMNVGVSACYDASGSIVQLKMSHP